MRQPRTVSSLIDPARHLLMGWESVYTTAATFDSWRGLTPVRCR
jgi:hypothetical protein